MKKAILGETRMNRIKTFVGIAAFSLVVLALPCVESAQWGGYGRNYDYSGNGNNRNNRNIQATVRNLKNRARNFERAVDRYDDRNNNRRNGRWGGGGWGNNSGNLEGLANSFKNAADSFANEYGRGRITVRTKHDACWISAGRSTSSYIAAIAAVINSLTSGVRSATTCR